MHGGGMGFGGFVGPAIGLASLGVGLGVFSIGMNMLSKSLNNNR
jgi:hypothetical protein